MPGPARAPGDALADAVGVGDGLGVAVADELGVAVADGLGVPLADGVGVGWLLADSGCCGNISEFCRVGSEEVLQSLRTASRDGVNGIGDATSLFAPSFG